MGKEATCTVLVNGKAGQAKVLLETNEIILRGETRAVIPLQAILDMRVAEGNLIVTTTVGTYSLALGPNASKWEQQIRNPKSLLDKLGVKPNQRVLVVGQLDEAFLQLLAEKMDHPPAWQPEGASDLIFVEMSSRETLPAFMTLQAHLKPSGAIWSVRPKGSKAIAEAEVRKAALDAGLVDVKVASFSATHTAEKFVIPVSKR